MYKKIIKIIIIVLIWNLIYEVIDYIIKGEFKNIFIETLKNLFLKQGIYVQFWFLGSLILIDLFLPLISKIFRTKNFGIILTEVLIVICIIVDIFNIRMNYLGNNNIRKMFLQTFKLWTWFAYFCIGGCISKIDIKIINKKLLYIITSIIMIITLTSIHLFVNKLYGELYVDNCYDNILIFLTSTLIFYSIKNISLENIKCSFIRYFIKCSNNLANIFIVFLAFALSVVISYIISKIPKISKIIQF